MVKFKCALKGKFSIPVNNCVSCFKPVGASDIKIHASAGSDKSWLNMDFPLCFECDGIRNRVEAIEQKRAGKGCLVALPLGLLSYFIYHFITGREAISWIGLIGSWLVAYLVIYYLFERMLKRERANPREIEIADRVKSAVKLTRYHEPHAWTDGDVVIEFVNLLYAEEFRGFNKWLIIEELE